MIRSSLSKTSWYWSSLMEATRSNVSSFIVTNLSAVLALSPRIGVKFSFTMTKSMEYFFLFSGFLRVCRYVPRAVTLPPFQAWRVFFTGFRGRSEGWKRAGRTFTVEPVEPLGMSIRHFTLLRNPDDFIASMKSLSSEEKSLAIADSSCACS